jgi:hypothetical protein
MSYPPRVEQLIQLAEVTWDGNLISKSDRTALCEAGLAVQRDGWNVITPMGIMYLVNLGLLKP